MQSSVSGARVRVGHWRSLHLVPAGHPSPESVRDRVDSALRHELGSAIASALDRSLLESDEIIFIRTLRLDFMVDAAWDRDAIANACARAFTGELIREIAHDDSGNVVRFRNRAEYLARYAALRARASEPLPWCFSGLDGWALLPPTAAIRTALCEDPQTGRAALRLMTPHELSAVATCLSGTDAVTVVTALARTDRDTGMLPELLLAGRAAPASVIDGDGLPVWLLAHADASAAALQSGAVILRALSDACRRASAPSFEAAVVAAANVGPTLTALDAAARAAPGRARRMAIAFATTIDAVDAESRPPSVFTRLGGPFLLLDDLATLPIEDVTERWPTLGGTAATSVFRLLVAGQCLSPDGWRQMLDDTVWRDLFRVARATAPGDVEGWLSSLDEPQRAALSGRLGDPSGDACVLSADCVDTSEILPPEWASVIAQGAGAVLRRFARRLPGFAESGANYLQRHFLCVTATIEAEPQRVVVTLSRPPLDLVLRLTGRNRGERRWPFLDRRPFELFVGD